MKVKSDDQNTYVFVLEPGIKRTNQPSSPFILDAINQASDNKYAFNPLSRLESFIQRQLFETVEDIIIHGVALVESLKGDYYHVRSSNPTRYK